MKNCIIEIKENTITIKKSDKLFLVEIVNDNVVHFLKPRVNNFENEFVSIHKVKTMFNVKEENDYVEIDTLNLKIFINDNFEVSIKNSKDEYIIEPDKSSIYSYKNNLIENLEEQRLDEEKQYAFMITNKIGKLDKIYGLGDKTGFLNKRNYLYINYNTDDPTPHLENFKSLYKSIPFFICLSNKYTYGIYLNNTYKSIFDFTNPNNYTIKAVDGNEDYYFIYSLTIKDVLYEYTSLLGRYPLPQRWTLGYHQSRWSYDSKEKVNEIVNNFIKYEIPCDVIHLDIDYMDNYKVFTINDKKFPDFKNYIKDLNSKGFKIVTIIDPGVKLEKGYEMYDEGIENNFFATLNNVPYVNQVWPGDALFPSFTNSNVQKWWSSKINRLTSLGVSGIWNDMNEPASFKRPLPDDVVFEGNNKKHLHKEVHNVYGHFMAQATYEGLKNATKKRPFIITRAAFSGTQKYSTVWTGDNHSIFEHLRLSIIQMMNLGLSGYPFAGCDIGGFGSDCNKELMIRWIQVGAFFPLMRNHSAMGTKMQEPWQFDEETINIYRKYVQIRYRLIPYFYDLFYNHTQNGRPIIRPLVFEFQNDENTHQINDQFMVGSSIMVAPIVNQGETKRMVYFPEGIWYDFYTKESITSGYKIVNGEIDHCPVFVKEGSIIPNYQPLLNLDNEQTILILELYSNKGCYRHYQDDGKSFDYESGKYNLYDISISQNMIIVNIVHLGYRLYDKIIINHLNKQFIIKLENGISLYKVDISSN